jgi:uncharacterized protein YjdB
MRDRLLLGALLLSGLVIPITGCTNTSGLDFIQVSPSSQSLTVGQTAQFTATGIYGNASHPSSKDITSGVTWSSSTPSVASISASGVATALGAGTTVITAKASAYNGPTTATATLTVTAASGGGIAGGSIVSITVIPGAQSVSSPTQTSQFIAIGTTSSGATENLTNTVTWSSSSPQIATVGASTGLATAVGQGTATITALYTDATNGTAVTGTATFTVTGGATQQFTALAISPGSQSLSATGQTGQFIALATSGTTGLLQDVTDSPEVVWSSSIPTIATVSKSGLAAGVSAGTSTITAELTNPDGSVVTATANVVVTATAAPEPLLSITVLPNSITTNNLLGTGQFLAYGTFSTAPTVMDITNGFTRGGVFTPVTWVSTAPYIFPINSAGAPGATGGLVTAVGSGTDDIYAVAANPDGTLVYSPPVTFNCPYVAYVPATDTTPATLGSCNQETIASGLLVTLTVFNAGLNTSNWLVTAPSATGTPDVIHCGPGSTSGGSVCTATYPLNTKIILTAPAQTGVNFGGWSWNCTPSDANGVPLPGPVYWTAAGPNYCYVILGANDSSSSNESVGAIFN